MNLLRKPSTPYIPYIWDGLDDINLGRHGRVKRGDLLMLTDAEAASLAEDPRYVPATAIVRGALENIALDAVPEAIRRAVEAYTGQTIVAEKPAVIQPEQVKPEPPPASIQAEKQEAAEVQDAAQGKANNQEEESEPSVDVAGESSPAAQSAQPTPAHPLARRASRRG